MCMIETSQFAEKSGFYKKNLSEGWYEFMVEHNNHGGDTLHFEFSTYPYELKVRMVRPRSRN
jgi:hypothetical protein